MSQINFFKVSKTAMDNLIKMEEYLHNTTIEPLTRELVKIRASQINGCAYCLNMHTKDALKMGETNQRIFLLDAYKETSLFSEKEKAALMLTDKLTKISNEEMTPEFRNNILKFYSDKEYADLVILISQINTWNRINISTNNDIDDSK